MREGAVVAHVPAELGERDEHLLRERDDGAVRGDRLRLGAREQPLNLAITTAGYNRHTILGRLYADAMRLPDVRREGMLTVARDPAAGFLMWWYGLADDDEPTPENVLAANPASWITSAVLEAQRESPTVDEYAFRRLHANQWTSTRNAWMPAGAWDGLASEGYTIPDGSEVVVAVDVGLVHDSTAVAVAARLDDGIRLPHSAPRRECRRHDLHPARAPPAD